MDLWVVAAVAGAGYVAKNLQNLSLDNKKESSFNAAGSESTTFLQQLRDATCPFQRLARKKKKAAFADSFDELGDRVSESGVASSCEDALGECNGFNITCTEESLEFEGREVREFAGVKRGSKLVRNWNCVEDSIRPIDCLGSFLDAQLCRGLEGEEEIMSGLVPLLTGVRVNGKSRMLSRPNSDSCLVLFEGGRDEVVEGNGGCLEACDAKQGCGSLLPLESAEDVDKECKRGSGNLELSGSSGEAPSQGPDRVVLFLVGMTVGILSATMASRNGVDKLNKQLKQTQNLVQDLHEELDMKDMLTVKELKDGQYLPPGDSSETPLSSHEPNASPSDSKANNLPKSEKATENVELMSQIEAELEAELEMLERNMKDSTLERVSHVVEQLDSDFEPEIVKGGLDPAMVSEIYGGLDESINETRDTTPGNTYSEPPNYAVCPWELSLRLHELIEFRLKERVKELEIALGNSRTFQSQSSQSIALQKGTPYSGTGSSSSHHHTPTCIYEHDEREDGLLGKTFSADLINAYKDQGMNQDKNTWSGFTSIEDCESNDDGTDESETLLLKQILERTKSGSSFVLEFLRSSEA